MPAMRVSPRAYCARARTWCSARLKSPIHAAHWRRMRPRRTRCSDVVTIPGETERIPRAVPRRGLARRGGQYPVWAPTVAVGAARRLRCDARDPRAAAMPLASGAEDRRAHGRVRAARASTTDSRRLFEHSERIERREFRRWPCDRGPEGIRSEAEDAALERR